MNDAVKKVFSEQTVFLATYGDGANVVPVGFKAMQDDGSLIIGDVFMNTTKQNILANGQAAAVAWDKESNESYMVKGPAVYQESGEVVDMLNQMAEKAGLPIRAKGAVIIKAEKIMSKTPGENLDKEI